MSYRPEQFTPEELRRTRYEWLRKQKEIVLDDRRYRQLWMDVLNEYDRKTPMTDCLRYALELTPPTWFHRERERV